jgi:hypothetical protein
MIKENMKAGNMEVTRQIPASITILYDASTGSTWVIWGRPMRSRAINRKGKQNMTYSTGSRKISLRSFFAYVKRVFTDGPIR